MGNFKTYIVLDNIRSAENVGSIFRTADAIGISKIFLVGLTPRPLDRFGREQPKIKKVALGAEKTVPWEYCEEVSALITHLKSEKITVVAVEQNEMTIDYKEYVPKSDTAFIFGREVEGIDDTTLKLCDTTIEIPMHGKKESLNVSVAAGVVLYRMLDGEH